MPQRSDSSLHDLILADIGTGAFPFGTRLKAQDLALRYGTSSIPVREALRQLQGEGIVEIAPNKGATVARVDATVLREISEIVGLLHRHFTVSFARYCSEADLIDLEAAQTTLEGIPPDDRVALERADCDFHAVIARRCGNRRAYRLWLEQRRILTALSAPAPLSATRVAAIISEHRALIAAFRAGDVESARKCIERHVGNAGAIARNHMARLP